MIKVVIDTNIIISAALTPSGKPAKIIDMVFEDKLQILSEYKDVLSRLRLKIDTQTQIDILDVIREVGTLIEPTISNIPFISVRAKKTPIS